VQLAQILLRQVARLMILLRYRRPSRNQKAVNAAHARQRGPGERVNAQLKNWRILRKIRSGPSRADDLVAAVQNLMIANA
jgi:hypothetical protein